MHDPDKGTQEVFQEEKLQLQRLVHKKMKGIHKAKAKCDQDLIACSQWEKFQHEGSLLQSNLFKIKRGQKVAVVHDWNTDSEIAIPLDPLLEPSKQAAALFRKSRKLRIGLDHIPRRRAAIEAEIAACAALEDKLAALHTLKELQLFRETSGLCPTIAKELHQEKRRLPYHIFTTEAGLHIWVGKSARDNDALTFRHANGSDWWMHVSDYAGSHVVLRGAKGSEPDDESLKDAMQMALVYSKAKDSGEADVCITQCKYVTRFGKSSPGKVQISKHRSIHVRADKARVEAIKKRE